MAYYFYMLVLEISNNYTIKHISPCEKELEFNSDK